MQQMEQTTVGTLGAERQRIEVLVETLAEIRSQGETVAEVAHDARNMVTALGLYCDLLEAPGVLAGPYSHYGSELRLVAAASRRLVEKLVELDFREGASRPNPAESLRTDTSLTGKEETVFPAPAAFHASACAPACVTSPAALEFPAPALVQSAVRPAQATRQLWDLAPAEPINNLAAEIVANRNLLASLAGTSITLATDADGGAKAVRLTGEDLTRVLINLVKNACEAIASGGRTGGRIEIGLREQFKNDAVWLVLTVGDSGPGIPEENLEKVFQSGFTAVAAGATGGQNRPSTRPSPRRGLGLAITRSIVESAGGRIEAANRAQGGACFTIQLPVRW